MTTASTFPEDDTKTNIKPYKTLMTAFGTSLYHLLHPNHPISITLDPEAEADAYFEAEKLRYEEQIEILEDAIDHMNDVNKAWIIEHEKLAKEFIETQAEVRRLIE